MNGSLRESISQEVLSGLYIYIPDSFIHDPELTECITPMEFTYDTAEPFGTGTEKATGKMGNRVCK